MGGGYSKLFSGLVTSSIWLEDRATIIVWIAFLAICDANGVVSGSLPGLAHLARVSLDEMRTAIEVLSSPDPDSRSPENEGRRIEKVQDGWRILNYAAYRSKLQGKQGSRAIDMRRYRESRRNPFDDDGSFCDRDPS